MFSNIPLSLSHTHNFVFGGGSKQTLEREGLHGMGPPLSWSLERERESDRDRDKPPRKFGGENLGIKG